jgi:hypothetical protein
LLEDGQEEVSAMSAMPEIGFLFGGRLMGLP